MNRASEKNVLLIVEGAKREPQLMERLFESFDLSDNHQIVPVKINVHDFLNKLFQEYGCDFEAVDLKPFVAELLSDKDDAAQLLESSFTDTLLIFDLDPQDNRLDFKRLELMQDYYCDSTDMGQLFLSYPSVEAYRDFDTFGYSSLDDALVPSDVIFGQRSYKEWVARRGDSLADIDCIDGYTFVCIVAVHALRSLWLTDGQVTQNAKESLVDLAGTVRSINHSELLLNEIDRLNNDSFCACCTCLFFIANWPKRLNDVWHKAVMRGLGIRLCKSHELPPHPLKMFLKQF